MTLPIVVGVGTVAAGTGDVVPTLPAGWQADDIFLMVVEQSAVNAFGSPPSGWALVTNTQQKAGSAATDGNIQVYWRRAVAGDGDPTVADTINHTSARIIAIRGCVTSGNPWDVTNGGTDTNSNTSLSVTGNTTSVNDCLIVIFFGTGPDIDSTTEVSGWANSDLANVTERMDNWNSNGNGGGFGCATGEKASSGSYGNTTATLVTASTKAFATIALKPAGGTQYNQSVGGTLTSAGGLVKQANTSKAGTLTSAGVLVKQGGKILAGALSNIAGAMQPQAQKALSGTLTTSGALVNQGQKNVSGTLTSEGTLVKQTSTAFSGTLTSDGGLVKQAQKVLDGIFSSAGDLIGSKVSLISLSGTLTSAGELVKQTSKAFAGTLTSDGGLVKQAQKVLDGIFSSAGDVVGTKVALVSLSGTLTSAGALVKQTSKAFAGTLTSGGGLVKQAQKILDGVLSSAGNVVGTKVALVSLSGTLSSAGTLIKQTMMNLSGNVTSAGTVTKNTSKSMEGTISPSGTLTRTFYKTVSGVLSAAGGVGKSIWKMLTGGLSSAGTLQTSTTATPAVPPANVVSNTYVADNDGLLENDVRYNVPAPGTMGNEEQVGFEEGANENKMRYTKRT